MRWLGVFIAPQPLPSHWQRLLAIGALDSPMPATSARPLGFGAVDRWRALSSCCIGQSGATPDSPVTSDFCALTSVAALFISDISTIDRWCAGRRCSTGSSDSPVNYSRARLRILEIGLFERRLAWCTGQFPVCQRQHTLSPFCSK
jgi:hypothetical protein